MLGKPLNEIGTSHLTIAPYAKSALSLPCPVSPEWRVLPSVDAGSGMLVMIAVVLNRLSKDSMTTPGFGTNSYSEQHDLTPASAHPASAASEQRNNVPIMCAIAILIALMISGIVIWNDVRSTSQEVPVAGENSDTAVASEEPELEPKDSAAEEAPPITDAAADNDAAADASDVAAVPPGLTAAGWSDFPEARCQNRESMVFAAAGSDPNSHIVICESHDSLFYRGVWSSGAAFGPARGNGTDFSAAIVDPASGATTGSVLTIRGKDYAIDGDTGVFDVYWPK